MPDYTYTNLNQTLTEYFKEQETKMDLLISKKFRATLLASIVAIVNNILEEWLGVSLDPQTLIIIVGALLTFVLGQGIADNGKEAAKVKNKVKS